MNIVSTFWHGVADYMSAATLLSAPMTLSLPAGSAAEKLCKAAALGTLSNAAITNFELGLVPATSMRTHLAMDAGLGAALIAASLMVPQRRAALFLAGMGLSELALAMLTEAQPRRAPLVSGLLKKGSAVAEAAGSLSPV